MNRLTHGQLTAAVAELEAIVDQVDHVEVTGSIARTAGDFTGQHALRAYDAVHLAAMLTVADDDLLLGTGDKDLAAAASTVGITVSATAA